eukprot:TRINITY_DN16805_c0_g1_i1.p3 TRINITY_DN16805_c0_g1~~TRINITY_DN16805_c0_g1_i1.p3  ORF type:complete len:106 (-),score=11.45 TRINITY_DN16805_c0_g1_i1:269-586(-)
MPGHESFVFELCTHWKAQIDPPTSQLQSILQAFHLPFFSLICPLFPKICLVTSSTFPSSSFPSSPSPPLDPSMSPCSQLFLPLIRIHDCSALLHTPHFFVEFAAR